MKFSKDLRELLDGHFKEYQLFPLAGGGSDAKIYSILTEDNRKLILKTQPSSLENEYSNYKWLEKRTKVPEVIFYSRHNKTDFLCMTELRGYSLDHFIGEISPDEVIRRFSETLKSLHSLVLDQTTLVQNLDQRLLQAEKNLKENRIDISELEPENKDLGLINLHEKLLSLKPSTHELVFTHGDYCFDNLIFDNEKFSGFIDLGNAGVADKYQDIALAVRSITHEFGKDLVSLFFDVYGLNHIDYKKIEFYQLLDEFF